MSELTFKSSIRAVDNQKFAEFTCKIGKKYYADYPWTLRESVKAPCAYTRRIIDCSMLGITDGQDVFMTHLCPTMDENSDYSKIYKFITANINLKSPFLQGLLIGAKLYPKSFELNAVLEKFLQMHKIPYSLLKTGKTATNAAYSSITDEWIISSAQIDIDLNKKNSPETIYDNFQKVLISDLDELV